MTDSDLVARKLALIETYLRQLRTLAVPGEILTNLVVERFAEHTLQITIQAALDVASHIVADERLAEPTTNQGLMQALAKAGWLSADLSARLQRMAGFRNVLVHGYAEVDPHVVRDSVENHLGDLEAFVSAIRAAIPR
jgi:uncharacterized protein YutE (UPF0331/DUF86 family)